MKLRLKKKKKGRGGRNKKDQEDEPGTDGGNHEEGSNKPILEIQLRHGDVATMCDTRLQAFTEVNAFIYLWTCNLICSS